LNQILRRQTSRSHYGSKVPAVTVTVFKYRNKIGKIVVKAIYERINKIMRPMFLPLFNKNQLFLIETLTKNKTLGKIERELKNGQSTGTGNTRHTRHRTKKNKTGRTTKMSNTDPTKHWW
jgi:hypothetical protein